MQSTVSNSSINCRMLKSSKLFPKSMADRRPFTPCATILPPYLSIPLCNDCIFLFTKSVLLGCGTALTKKGVQNRVPIETAQDLAKARIEVPDEFSMLMADGSTIQDGGSIGSFDGSMKGIRRTDERSHYENNHNNCQVVKQMNSQRKKPFGRSTLHKVYFVHLVEPRQSVCVLLLGEQKSDSDRDC